MCLLLRHHDIQVNQGEPNRLAAEEAVTARIRKRQEQAASHEAEPPALGLTATGRTNFSNYCYACCGESFLRDDVFFAALVLAAAFLPAALIAPKCWTAD